MYRWYQLTLIGALGAVAACGGSDRHADTPADMQGGSMTTGGTNSSEKPGVPPGEMTPPTTPNSEPSNVPPESSLSPHDSPRADSAARAMLGAPAETLGNGGSSTHSGGSTGSGGRAQSGGMSSGARSIH